MGKLETSRLPWSITAWTSGREDRLVVVVDRDRRVGPPEEGLRLGGAVVKLDMDFQIGAVRVEAEAVRALGVEHALDLRAPDRRLPSSMFLDAPVEGHRRCWDGGAAAS